MPEKYNSFITHCKGRNRLQLPDVFVEARLVTGDFKSVKLSHTSPSFFVLVERNKLTKEEFSHHILKRRAELKDNATETVDILRLENKLNEYATLFRVQQIRDAYQDELHFLLGENLVIVKLDSYKNSFSDAEERLVKFMSDFSIRNEENNVKGFCLGSLMIQGDYEQESGSSFLRDNAGNTLDIKIDSFRTEDPESLLERMAGPGSLLSIFHIGHTVLRSGERTVAGMRAQEWLGWTNFGEGGDKKTFKFVLETTRSKGSKATPSIHITFDSAKNLEDGTETQTNLSDGEAMAMWDKVIDSIQPAK